MKKGVTGKLLSHTCLEILFLSFLLFIFALLVREYVLKDYPKKEIAEQRQKQYKQDQISKFIRYRISTMPIEYSIIIAQNIIGVSNEYKVPIDLLVGIIEKESCWNASVISSAGARGLMQILQGETVTVDTEQVHNIHYNLSIGSKILNYKIKAANGDLNLALSNYSGGAIDYTNDVLVCMGRWILFQQTITRDDNE